MTPISAVSGLRWLPLSLVVALAGCASNADVYEKHVRTEDATSADVMMTLDVAFARAPDYEPRTLEYGSTETACSSRSSSAAADSRAMMPSR